MNGFSAKRENIVLKTVDEAAVERLSSQLNIHKALASILVGRGLDNYDACKSFFTPDASSFLDPFLFKGMRTAADRVRKAISLKERISVYGDYDADGVSATALTVRILRRLGATCDFYLPNRLTEGYGMSAKGINELSSRQTKVIISVDCGIGAVEEVTLATQLGIDCIITDHHLPQGNLPSAIAVLNPSVPECGYPEANLAGVGVALKLCQALCRDAGLDDSVWMEHLDIAALGTAADIVKLTGENRSIVSLGYEKLAHTSNVGLAALMEQLDIAEKPVSTREVVFQLAPCINAAGRLGDPGRGVLLLLTEDKAEAALYARELREANRERQALDAKVQQEALAWAEANFSYDSDMAVVAASGNWHPGVIGIAASRVVENFNRPAILFSTGPDGRAKGSGRSIPGLHLLDALTECSDLLESFGGHAAAAGATIRIENLDAFREKFNLAVKKRISPEALNPVITADAEIDIPSISRKFFNVLRRMEPFGPGNMRPVLLCRGCTHRYQPKTVGRGHLKMTISQHGGVMDAIAFNFGDRLDEIRSAAPFDIAFSLDENTWNNQVSLQMKVKGVRA